MAAISPARLNRHFSEYEYSKAARIGPVADTSANPVASPKGLSADHTEPDIVGATTQQLLWHFRLVYRCWLSRKLIP